MAELLALIDIGSNAVRCLLASITPRVGFRVLYKERVQTRLGGGFSGSLPQAAVQETLTVVGRFLRRVHKNYRPRVLAVATAAVRDASNRNTLLVPLQRTMGIEVQILSGEEEARLGAEAAMQSLSLQTGLVFDLGGGSLQCTQVSAGTLGNSTSFPLGAVRTTHRFLKTDPPTPQELQALKKEIRDQLGSVPPGVATTGELVGMGGTIRTLADMYLATSGLPLQSQQGMRLKQADVIALRQRLEALPTRDRRRLPGLKADRADIILAGIIVTEEVMTLGDFLTLIVCTGGVRHGLLLRETFNGGA
jgi:exopolyphosphatase/guanosine-5'-triphosphate,3'-diphosphate pyrophosphatase